MPANGRRDLIRRLKVKSVPLFDTIMRYEYCPTATVSLNNPQKSTSCGHLSTVRRPHTGETQVEAVVLKLWFVNPLALHERRYAFNFEIFVVFAFYGKEGAV